MSGSMQGRTDPTSGGFQLETRHVAVGALAAYGARDEAMADRDELERSYLATLPEIRSYGRSDSTLTLSGPGGPLARFRAP